MAAQSHLLATVTDGVVETSARVVDVSRGGVALSSDALWELGSRVRVRLRLSCGKSAVARALVRQTDNGRMGLELLAVGPRFSLLFGTVT